MVVTGALLGVYAAGMLRRRVKALELSIRLVKRMADQIRYTSPPVAELLEGCRADAAFVSLFFLKKACDLMREGKRFGEAWELALGEGEDGFQNTDRELLQSFGQRLGKTDVEGQLAHCRQTVQLLEERLALAKSQADTKGRLYLLLGFSGGVLLALMLI